MITAINKPETAWISPSTDKTTIVKPTTVSSQKAVRPGSTIKPLKPLTRKQQAFIRHLVDNPKASATQAVKQAYGQPNKPVTELSARNIASENLTKPNIMLELSKYSDTAESTLINVMQYSLELGKSGSTAGASYANNARQSANDVLNRLHGTPTSRHEVQSTAVTLNIDLTGVTDTEGS